MPLYVCPTPVGNLKDITLRVLDALKKADGIICEDTRVTSKLLSCYEIKQKLYIYNDQSTEHARNQYVKWLREGKTLCLVSDAGMPCICDPGFKIIRACEAEDLEVIVLPGPSSLINALVMSNYPPYPFYFGGFFDEKKFLGAADFTQIYFISCHKLVKALTKMKYEGELCVIREISKIYEEKIKGSKEELIEHYTKKPPKGEVVFVFPPSNYKYNEK